MRPEPFPRRKVDGRRGQDCPALPVRVANADRLDLRCCTRINFGLNHGLHASCGVAMPGYDPLARARSGSHIDSRPHLSSAEGRSSHCKGS